MKKTRSAAGVACALAWCVDPGASALGQARPASDGPALQLEEVVVTASTRLSDTIETFPGSYTVIDQSSLERSLSVMRDIADMLSMSVPGLGAVATGTTSNFEQTLRGRVARVFVDGIPMSTPLRDGLHDIRSIDGAAVERVEVIRGASALYGQGGSGGVINFITKRGGAGEEWRLRSELSSGFSTTHFEDSARPAIAQSARGSLGGFDMNFAARHERVHNLFDADGERLPPDPHRQGGIADSDITNLFGKIGYTAGAHRVEAMFNRYDQEQDTDFVNVSGDYAQGVPTSAVPGAQDPRARGTANRNSVGYLAYSNETLLGGGLRSQLYYVDTENVFSFEPTRHGGTYSVIASEKLGLQTDVRTPIELRWIDGGVLLWGFDVNRDTTEQPLLPIPSSGAVLAPAMRQMNYAVFAQLEAPLTERVTLRAGIRHDDFKLKVVEFVAANTRVRVGEGELDYAATPFNLGGTFQLTDAVQLFGGFSQGFSVPDVGNPLRNARSSDVHFLKPETALVNNWELGARGQWTHVHGTLAFFMSKSSKGTDFITNPQNPLETIILREKEEIAGVELTLGGDVGERTQWGASFAWSEGKRDSSRDGKIDGQDEYLSGRRIQPWQLNAHVGYRVTDDWFARLHLNSVGDRDRFPSALPNDFFRGEIEGYTKLDLLVQGRLGLAELSLGVSNLLNEDYYSVTSQMFNRDDRYTKAEGRAVLLKVMVDY